MQIHYQKIREMIAIDISGAPEGPNTHCILRRKAVVRFIPKRTVAVAD